MKRVLLLLVVAACFAPAAGAEARRFRPVFELTAADLPANIQAGYFFPSAQKGLSEASHWGIALLPDLIIPRQSTFLNLGLRCATAGSPAATATVSGGGTARCTTCRIPSSSNSRPRTRPPWCAPMPPAWVYDLFRPGEPYSVRGPHPSGVGLKRAIAWSDLTGEEQDFLRRQQLLPLINFANPFAFFVHHVGGERWQASLAARHTLTSFGYSVDFDAFLRLGGWKMYVSQKNQWNRYRWFPALELEAADLRLLPWLAVTPRLIAWLQPAGQEFSTRTAQPRLLASGLVRASAHPAFGVLAELGYKAEGWVSGL